MDRIDVKCRNGMHIRPPRHMCVFEKWERHPLGFLYILVGVHRLQFFEKMLTLSMVTVALKSIVVTYVVDFDPIW